MTPTRTYADGAEPDRAAEYERARRQALAERTRRASLADPPDGEAMTSHLAPIESAWAEVARLRGLLAQLEWAGTNPRNPVNPHCPVCGGWPANGHYPGCWLAKELGLEIRKERRP